MFQKTTQTPLSPATKFITEIIKMEILFQIIFILWCIRAIDLIIGLLFFIPMFEKEMPDATAFPKVSIIFATRNEGAKVMDSIQAMLRQDYPNLEVIAVNDRSDDGSEKLLSHFKDTRFKLISISELPSGWLGKTHALFQGYKASTGEWLLFTDADVLMSPETLKKAIAIVTKGNLDHLTLMPELIIKSYIEGAFTNYFALQFNFRYRPWMARFRPTLAYAGIGAFNFVKRSSYEKAGTHEKLALDIADDMMLGKLLKRAGFKEMLMYAGPLVRVRWVEGFKGVLNSLQKNAFRGLDYNLFLLIAATGALFTFDALPSILILCGYPLVSAAGGFLILTFLIYAAGQRFNRLSLLSFPAHPVICLLFLFILWRSALTALKEGGVRWRDTFYPLKDLKQAGMLK
jgi:glycosyltransferase involved in cell wall biosynthesis